jgi:hypothetical protein
LTSRLQGKRDVKIAAVERALAAADVETGQDEVDLNAAQKAELERLLKLSDEL